MRRVRYQYDETTHQTVKIEPKHRPIDYSAKLHLGARRLKRYARKLQVLKSPMLRLGDSPMSDLGKSGLTLEDLYRVTYVFKQCKLGALAMSVVGKPVTLKQMCAESYYYLKDAEEMKRRLSPPDTTHLEFQLTILLYKHIAKYRTNSPYCHNSFDSNQVYSREILTTVDNAIRDLITRYALDNPQRLLVESRSKYSDAVLAMIKRRVLSVVKHISRSKKALTIT